MEMFSQIFDDHAKTALKNTKGASLNYIHISDSYSRMIQLEEEEADKKDEELPARKVLVCSMFIDSDEVNTQSGSMVKTVMYLVDRVRRMRLTRDCKAACEKRRLKAKEEEQKRYAAARNERMKERTEQNRREEYQRVMAEEDPDKQRRLHAQMMKREDKKRTKKMSSM